MQKGFFSNLAPGELDKLISYPLTAAQFAYLKPALPEQVNRRALPDGDAFYCISTPDGLADIRARLQGLAW